MTTAVVPLPSFSVSAMKLAIFVAFFLIAAGSTLDQQIVKVKRSKGISITEIKDLTTILFPTFHSLKRVPLPPLTLHVIRIIRHHQGVEVPRHSIKAP